MPSLSQLLTDHRNLLVFDAASTCVQVGLIRPEAEARWVTAREEAGRTIFASTVTLLDEAGLRMDQIAAFIYCEGPGSMLGVRIVAMALRTWNALTPRPVYTYQSLALAGHFELVQNGKRDLAVIADARRDSWHRQTFAGDGKPLPLQRVAAVDLGEGELVTPENFRAWATLPRPLRTASYDLANIFPTLRECDYFRAVENPDAFQHEAPEYKKSPARIHSIATADKK